MNVFTKEFNLTEGVEQTFYDLKSGSSYYFFLEAKIKQTFKIDMNMNNMINFPFSEICIYELTVNNEPLNKEKHNILFYENDTQLIISPIFYQIKKSDTYYKVLRIQPFYDIEYLNVLIEADGKTYELIKGESSIFYNLRKGNNYYFYLRGKQFDIVTINLTLNDLKIEALTDLYIFETGNKEEIFYSTSQSISFSNLNSTLMATNIYSIKNWKNSYLSLKISPIYNINSMNISFDIQQGKYTIGSKPKKISNLRAKIKYYLSFSIDFGYEYNFNLITDYMKNKPFNYIKIYNCDSSFIYCNSEKNKTVKLNFKKKENGLVSSFSLSFPQNHHDFEFDSFIEFIPDYDINYLVVEVTEKRRFYNSKSHLILLIVIPCIIAIFIILAIISNKNIKSSKQIKLFQLPLKFPMNPKNINN